MAPRKGLTRFVCVLKFIVVDAFFGDCCGGVDKGLLFLQQENGLCEARHIPVSNERGRMTVPNLIGCLTCEPEIFLRSAGSY